MDEADGDATPPPMPAPDRPQSKHVKPPWSSQPLYDFALEVIKDGVVISTLPISDREAYVIGRQPDVCDILLDHPSVSRQHAALQYGEKGELYLQDLGSVHGTFLNKERLSPKVYTPFHVGSVAKFGSSTRLYVLQGPDDLLPPEEEDEGLAAARAASEARQERKAREREANKAKNQRDVDEAAGCLWGFDDDAVQEDDEDDEESAAVDEYGRPRGMMVKGKAVTGASKLEGGLKESEVHEKDRALFERMQQRLAKMDNIRSEIERIRAKEGMGGLTEGQEKQILKNEQAIARLQELVNETQDTIRRKNEDREAARSSTRRGGPDEADLPSDEDDFFDRTGGSKRKKRRRDTKPKSEEPETVQSLEAKLEAVHEKLRVLEESLAKERERLASEAAAASAGSSGQGDGDVLDAFMVQNAGNAQRDLEKALESEKAVLVEERKRLKRLLVLAQPALPGLKPKSATPAPAPVDASSSEGQASQKKAKKSKLPWLAKRKAPFLMKVKTVREQRQEAEAASEAEKPSFAGLGAQPQGTAGSGASVDDEPAESPGAMLPISALAGTGRPAKGASGIGLAVTSGSAPEKDVRAEAAAELARIRRVEERNPSTFLPASGPAVDGGYKAGLNKKPKAGDSDGKPRVIGPARPPA